MGCTQLLKQWNSQEVENKQSQTLAPHPQVVRTKGDHGQVPAAAQRELCEGTCVSRKNYRLGVGAAETAGN